MTASARQELQSTLVRLCVLCASSLEALRVPTVPEELVDEDAVQLDGAALSARIHADVTTLFRSVRKDTTALSLAVRPAPKDVPEGDGPLDGVDDSSVAAALQLLQSLANDYVPKCVFLANLATKHQSVHQVSDAVAQDESLALAKSMGARLVLGESAKGPKVVQASVGRLFAAAVRTMVHELVEHIGELCQSLMDERTREVLMRAYRKREGDAAAQRFAMPEATRAATLRLTKQIWTLCDDAEAVPSKSNLLVRLPRNNYEAMGQAWRRCEMQLRDGMDELRDAVESVPGDAEGAAEDDLEAMWDQHALLSEADRVVARHVHSLLRRGHQLFQNVYKALDPATYDCDRGAACVEELTELQDDLVASVLYEGEDGASDDGTTLMDVAAVRAAAQAYADACAALAATVAADVGLDKVTTALAAVL